MDIGVLALQGDFAEHCHMLEKLGATCHELRQRHDLEKNIAGLVLPGGESSVQAKLLKELDMLAQLKKLVRRGLPVLATCAGIVLLAEEVAGQGKGVIGTLPVRVKRNAYGRQLGSFSIEQEFCGLGIIEMRFIRAPYIEWARDDVSVLATYKNKIVAVRYENQFAMSFHPELTGDMRVHEMFLRFLGK